MKALHLRRRAIVAVVILTALALLPWFVSQSNQVVPPDLIAQPTAYQIKREAQQTATAQDKANAQPTPAATAFDVLAQPEGTETAQP